jgi:PII-like signaling protein
MLKTHTTSNQAIFNSTKYLPIIILIVSNERINEIHGIGCKKKKILFIFLNKVKLNK